MNTAAKILALVFLILAAAPIKSQAQEIAKRIDIENLIEYGFETKDVLAWLGEEGRRLEIDAADLAAMEKNGVDAKIITWLRVRLPETSAKKLDVAGVIELWQTDKNERNLLAAVKAAEKDWLLAPADVLALTRADVPKSVVEFMRGRDKGDRKKPTAGETLTLDLIMKMTADGLPASVIVARIADSPSHYDVDAQRILELKRDGVAIEVLQAIYERRVEVSAAVDVPPADEKPMALAAPAAPAEAAYTLLRNLGIGFTMLQPANWVATEQFVSTKSLVQIVDPSGADAKGLPDLELSVMNVHPKRRSDGEASAAQLEAIAASFTETLKGQFARDGIEMAAARPRRTWIAAQPALLIETQARVTATNVSYRGSFFILQARERIWVLSYSCRLEKCAQWLPVLDDCLRSFGFGDDSALPPSEAEDKNEEVAGLFDNWRRSVRRFDFDTFRKLHEGLDDGIEARRAFLALAASVNDEGKRLEIDGVDFKEGAIHYNVFGLDGQTRAELAFLKAPLGYRLMRRGR